MQSWSWIFGPAEMGWRQNKPFVKLAASLASWAQEKTSGKFKFYVQKIEAENFESDLEAIESIREVRLFAKNCTPVSRLLRYKWFFCTWVPRGFPSITVEQVNCLYRLEEKIHFWKYLKILGIRELKVKVKKMAHNR